MLKRAVREGGGEVWKVRLDRALFKEIVDAVFTWAGRDSGTADIVNDDYHSASAERIGSMRDDG